MTTTGTLSGNTFPVRDQIKAIGGTWDAASKSWTVTAGTMKEKSAKSAAVYSLRKSGVVVTQS